MRIPATGCTGSAGHPSFVGFKSPQMRRDPRVRAGRRARSRLDATHGKGAPDARFRRAGTGIRAAEPAQHDLEAGSRLSGAFGRGPAKPHWPAACAVRGLQWIGMTQACDQRVGDPSDWMGISWDVDYCWRVQLGGMKLTFVKEARVHSRLRSAAPARLRPARSWGWGKVALQIRYGDDVRADLHAPALCLLGFRLGLRPRAARFVSGPGGGLSEKSADGPERPRGQEAGQAANICRDPGHLTETDGPASTVADASAICHRTFVHQNFRACPWFLRPSRRSVRWRL